MPRRSSILLALSTVALALGAAACGSVEGPEDGFRRLPSVAAGEDTVVRVMTAGELRARRDEWRRTRDDRAYAYTVETYCFCGGGLDHPARVTVEGRAVASIVRRDGGPIAFRDAWLTFEQLFDLAIAEVEGGGRVRASWSVGGAPRFIEIGTMENDAGIGRRISDVGVRD